MILWDKSDKTGNTLLLQFCYLLGGSVFGWSACLGHGSVEVTGFKIRCCLLTKAWRLVGLAGCCAARVLADNATF